MFVLKNRNDPKLSEANIHARLCHLTQLLKNSHSMMLALFLFSDEKILTVITPKNPQNDRLYARPSTKKKDVVTMTYNACAHISVQSHVASVGE